MQDRPTGLLSSSTILSSQMWWVSLNIHLQGFHDSQFHTWNFWTLFLLWRFICTQVPSCKGFIATPLNQFLNTLPTPDTIPASVQPREPQFPDAGSDVCSRTPQRACCLWRRFYSFHPGWMMGSVIQKWRREILYGISKQQQTQKNPHNNQSCSSPNPNETLTVSWLCHGPWHMCCLIYYSQQPTEIGSPISQMKKLSLEEIKRLPRITRLTNDAGVKDAPGLDVDWQAMPSCPRLTFWRRGRAWLKPSFNLVKSNTVYHSQVHDCF